jgi:hypothetical protein
MTIALSEFHAAVTRLLATMPHLPAASIDALRSSDPSVSGPVALRVLQHLVTPVQLVVDVDLVKGHGFSADRPLRLLELRRGADITSLDPEDVFPFTYDGKTESVNATFEGSTIAARYVFSAFDAANQHRANRAWRDAVDREDAASRQYRIEWVHGYGDVPPAVYPLTWFDPAGDRGFELEDAEALLQLQVGEAKDFTSPTWHTRVTRVS